MIRARRVLAAQQTKDSAQLYGVALPSCSILFNQKMTFFSHHRLYPDCQYFPTRSMRDVCFCISVEQHVQKPIT